MAILPPQIQTYHCLCSSLLLASTHTLSSLPRRSSDDGHHSLDSAIILPLPPSPPDLSPDSSDLPVQGYTKLTGVSPDRKITLVRREDGFEKRVLYRCTRCKLVIGYELQAQTGDAMDIDEGSGKGKGKEEGYTGKVLYLIPAGVLSTDVMVRQNAQGGRRVGAEDVDVKRGALAAFE